MRGLNFITTLTGLTIFSLKYPRQFACQGYLLEWAD